MFTKIAAFFRRSQDIGSEEYERINILQKTNMSEVWLARRKRDRLITVTKIARVDQARYASANQEAIFNEANWLGKFRSNPRIVQIYHSAETNLPNNPRFIAVEYLEGGTLENVLQQRTWRGKVGNLFGRNGKSSRRPTGSQSFAAGSQNAKLYRGRLPVEQALQVFGYVAEGLALMHSQGVVHRDIKPDNIMFRRRPLHGRVIEPNNLVLIDLGIAAPLNRPAGAAVSRGWSDPRCIEARESRRKIVSVAGFDVYSLGRVLRFMVTGERPKEDTLEADLKTSIEPHLLRFSKRRAPNERTRIAQQISGLIQACLLDDIDRRPSAAQLVARTDAMLKELSPRPSRLRQGLAVTVAVLLAALLMGGILASSQEVPNGSSPLDLMTTVTDPISARVGNLIGARADAQSPLTATPLPTAEPANGTPTALPTPLPAEEPTSTVTQSMAAGNGSADTPATAIISATAMPAEEVAANLTPPSEPSVTEAPAAKIVATAAPTNTSTQVPPTSTSPPAVTRRPTPARTPTTAPTATPASRATSPTAVPPPASPPAPAPASAVTIEVLQENESHACATGSPDTWHFDVRLVWRYKDGNRPLPAGSSFEVVTWLDNGDPLNPGQAYTIHGADEIVPLDNGKFMLERKPKALVPVFTSLKGGALAADTLYKWGIVQVAQGRRVALLTPGEGCKFVVHADILKK
ncbi:MAG: protein kinase [Caldilineaceae bacterium]